MRYSLFLFDLDGTVLDTIGMIAESLRHALNLHLNDDPDHDTLVQGVGTPLVQQFVDHATRLNHPITDPLIEAMVDTYREHNLAIHDHRAHAFPGADALFTSLRNNGTRLGIVTSKPHDLARRGLRINELEHHFDYVVGSDDVERHKPDPEPVHKALNYFNAPPNKAIFIGDSPHDMLAGRAAGVSTGAALWGPFSRTALAITEPTYWLETFDHLLELR